MATAATMSAAAQESYSGTVVADEGAWCWFADPRALHYENEAGTINATYLGYIDVHGNVKATQYDWIAKRKTDVLIRSYFQPDDHNNPTFVVLPDERVMIFYTRHTDEAKIWYRISQKPGDISQLGPEKSISVANNTTYPSPFIMSDDPGHIYLCWRGINWHPTIARITMPDTNDNVTVDFGPKQIVQSTGARPYAKYQSNGKDKIYLTYTTGHPDNEMPNWLYFNVVDINHGNGPILRDIKGTELKKIADGVFNVNKTASYKNSYPYTLVDAPASVRDWVWQIALDKEEKPVIGFTHIDDAKTTHVYWYGRWTGEEWRLTWVQYAGHAFHQNWNSTEKCYTGGMAIDPDNINDIYLSIPTRNGVYHKDGVYEIWKYTIDDEGKVAGSEQITKNSSKNNARPFILPGSSQSPLRLAWMNGDYYYWIVKTGYPNAFPTAIHSDYDLPTEPIALADGMLAEKGFAGTTFKSDTWTELATAETPCAAYTIAVTPTFSDNKYQGEIVSGYAALTEESDPLWTLGLNSAAKLYVKVGSTTYTSPCYYYTSDDWATRSSGTSGDNWPTKIVGGNLTVSYDGSHLILYRNGLVELKLDVDAETSAASRFKVGKYDGTMGVTRVYDRALNQDEVKALADDLSTSLDNISVPETVSSDIVLPKTLNGKAITWTSSNTGIITTTGLVTLPSSATDVTLTASIGDKSKTFETTVLPRDINRNAVLAYTFEKDSYTVSTRKLMDLTGHGHDLSVRGNASIDGTLNIGNNTPDCSSTNGYGVVETNCLQGVRSYTFLTRIKQTKTSKQPRLYDFGSNSSNSLFLRYNALSAGLKYQGGTTNMVNPSQQLTTGTVYDLAVSYDAKTKSTKVYVNGELKASGTNITNEAHEIGGTYNLIGRTQWASSIPADNNDFIGTLDNFFLYDIALTADEIWNVQVNASTLSVRQGWGTICVSTPSMPDNGLKIYTIAGTNETHSELYLLPHEGVMEPGFPYVYHSVLSSKNVCGFGHPVAEPQTTNGLAGTFLSITPASQQASDPYVLSEGKWVRAEGTAIVLDNSAYIPDLNEIPVCEPTADVMEIDSTPTGIAGISAKANNDQDVYTLTGIKTPKPVKGIYIQAGKKLFDK